MATVTNSTAVQPFVSLVSGLFFAVIGFTVVQIVLTIAYALYLIREEKMLTGTITIRRILESAITITGAVESGLWFMLIVFIWYLPVLGLSIFTSMGLAGVGVYVYDAFKNHGLPSDATYLYFAISTPLLAYMAYEQLGFFGFALVLETIIVSFVLADIVMYILRNL